MMVWALLASGLGLGYQCLDVQKCDPATTMESREEIPIVEVDSTKERPNKTGFVVDEAVREIDLRQEDPKTSEEEKELLRQMRTVLGDPAPGN